MQSVNPEGLLFIPPGLSRGRLTVTTLSAIFITLEQDTQRDHFISSLSTRFGMFADV